MGKAAKSTERTGNDADEIATVRIELVDSEPLIWRQVEVPTSITLTGLHDVIQAAMGWFDYHLWEFTIAKRRYGLPMDDDWGVDPPLDASKVRLGEPGVGYPRYVAGEHVAPPEDSGGIPGFYAKLEALADPSHPDHDDIAEWLKGYDPHEFDELPIKLAIGRIAARRRGGRARRKKAPQ